MDYAELPAPAPLDSVVRCFWFLRDESPGAAVQPVVPDGRAEIILHLGEPFGLAEGGRIIAQTDAIVSGQITRPIHLVARGPTDIVGIRFRTAGAAALLGGALPSLTDIVTSLADVSPTLSNELRSAASRHAAPHDRVTALARVLIARLRLRSDPTAAWAVAELSRDRSSAPVERLAKETGLSVRTLERRVRESVGIPPRLIRGIMRFRKAFALLDQTPAGRWAHIALASGYYDQAHLLRDFRRFAGASPSRFFAGRAELAREIMSSGEDAA